MALKGYIAPNTYTSITNTIYERPTKRCTVVMTIYKDDSKECVLGNISVVAEGFQKVPALVSLSPVKTVPKNIEQGVFFLIAQDAEDNLKGLEGRIARIGLSGSVESYILENERFLLHIEDEQKYYNYKNNQWVENTEVLADTRIWDKWLAPEVAMADGTNPSKQMYKLIKTLPQFKDCEDV